MNWSSNGVRRASVNNLGFGGTNAHAILEEASGLSSKPEFEVNDLSKSLSNGITNGLSTHLTNGFRSKNNNIEMFALNECVPPSHRLYFLTANDKNSLRLQMDALWLYLQRQSSKPRELLSDLAFTLGQRRSLLPWRNACVASSLDDLMEQLKSAKSVPTRASKEPRLGFVFTGQGAHWYAMGRELSQAYPIFASAIEDADRHLRTLGASWSLIGLC